MLRFFGNFICAFTVFFCVLALIQWNRQIAIVAGIGGAAWYAIEFILIPRLERTK